MSQPSCAAFLVTSKHNIYTRQGKLHGVAICMIPFDKDELTNPRIFCTGLFGFLSKMLPTKLKQCDLQKVQFTLYIIQVVSSSCKCILVHDTYVAGV